MCRALAPRRCGRPDSSVGVRERSGGWSDHLRCAGGEPCRPPARQGSKPASRVALRTLASSPRRPDNAAAVLREALALWRDPPLVEFRFQDFAANEIRRLDELRLLALERCLEADIALGNHANSVPELVALIREHPLRETLRRLLMLALSAACYRPPTSAARSNAFWSSMEPSPRPFRTSSVPQNASDGRAAIYRAAYPSRARQRSHSGSRHRTPDCSKNCNT